MTGRVRGFIENFGKPPAEIPPPMIPQRWRMPVFVTMVVVGLVLLALFVVLVVAPAMRSNSLSTKSATSAGSARRSTQ